MRIGYFVPGWPPNKVPNGIAATLGRLGDALERLGHEVYFITPQLVDGEADPRVSVICPRSRPGLIVRFLFKLDSERTFFHQTSSAIRAQLQLLLIEKKIEIFEMEETAGWVRKVAEALPIPVVTRLHGPWFTQAGIPSRQKVRKSDRSRIAREGFAMRSSFAVSAPSQAVLTSAQHLYGSFPGLTKVIPNPIPLPAHDKVWNYETCDKSRILFVGRFDEIKGADVVLRAFSELVKARPTLQLTIVGPDIGVQMQNRQFARLSEFVQSELPAEAAAKINYLGSLPRSEINALRQKAMLTVIASRYETFPNTVLEAMAVGSPIIATSVGGIPEMLENCRNALMIEPDSPGALASACIKMIDNPQLAIKLAAQARIDCSNRFHPEIIAKKHIEFYTEVIERFSRRESGK